MDDWLATLELMAAYRKYFTAAELRKIFRNWKRTRGDWAPLLAEVRDAQSRAVAPDSPEAQRLAHRWMDLSMRWMQGDLLLAQRWGQLYEQEAAANGHHGIDTNMIEFMRKAIELRIAALHRHLTPEDVQRLDKSLGREWNAFAERARRLLSTQADPGSKEAQALAADWDSLVNRTVGHDPELRARFERAYRSELGSPSLRDQLFC